MEEGITAPEAGFGPEPQLTVENSYLRNHVNVAVPTNGSVNGCWMDNKLVVLSNTRFEAPPGRSLSAIAMVNDVAWAPECLGKLDEARVYAYNGVATDNFQVYHNSTSVLPRPPAGCTPATRAGITGLTCPIGGQGPVVPTATLSASPASITGGAASTLTWATSNATSVSLNQGIGTVAAAGTRSVSPAATTTYTLTATNAAGSVTATATITVGTPTPTVNVPNVVGLAQAAATSALTAVGLRVGTVTTAPSATVAVGSVISANPAAGTSVAAGSAVDLVVSTGAGSGVAAPVAAYGFNEGAGTTTTDASGNGRTGALTNATWTAAGKYGGALSFNGSASRVTVADAASLHLSTAMTLEAWINPSGTVAASWQALIYKGVDNYFLAMPDHTTAPIVGGTIGGDLILVTSSSALPPGTWTHLAMTYDGSMLRLFVNGTPVAGRPATGLLGVSASPLEIGGSLVDGGPFAGLIDDVRVYDTALSPAQIQGDMTTPVGGAGDTQPPTAPTTLAVTAVSTTELALTWTESTDNRGVTGYRIERCAGAGCTTFSQVGTASATAHHDAGLVASTLYAYRVRATDAAGNLSGYSSSANGTTLPPAATPAPTMPAGPTPVSGATGVSLTPTLSWAASTNATQYSVAFGPTNPPAVVSSSQTATTYRPVALIDGTRYYWRIVAVGPGGSTSGPVWSLTTAADARPAPIAAYAFNEGAGTTTADASGNGRTGVLTNATWTAAGRYGGALSFNGSSSRVTVADAAPLHLSTAMTLEAWVRPSGTGAASWQALIYKGVDNYFLAMPDHTTAPIVGGTIGGGLVLVTSPSAIPAQTWTHVALTYDGSVARLFVNAAQVASRTATGLIGRLQQPTGNWRQPHRRRPVRRPDRRCARLQHGADAGPDSGGHDDADHE